jgi:hypothetical protein
MGGGGNPPGAPPVFAPPPPVPCSPSRLARGAAVLQRWVCCCSCRWRDEGLLLLRGVRVWLVRCRRQVPHVDPPHGPRAPELVRPPCPPFPGRPKRPRRRSCRHTQLGRRGLQTVLGSPITLPPAPFQLYSLIRRRSTPPFFLSLPPTPPATPRPTLCIQKGPIILGGETPKKNNERAAHTTNRVCTRRPPQHSVPAATRQAHAHAHAQALPPHPGQGPTAAAQGTGTGIGRGQGGREGGEGG